MKKIVSFILLLSVFISCSSKKEKPDPFFEHDKMVDLMTDLSLTEGARMYARPDHKNLKEGEYSINEYYALVLTKYNLTQVELDSINAWYISYPDEYQFIFKEVLDRLNKMQAEEKSRSMRKAKLLKKPNSKEVIKDILVLNITVPTEEELKESDVKIPFMSSIGEIPVMIDLKGINIEPKNSILTKPILKKANLIKLDSMK